MRRLQALPIHRYSDLPMKGLGKSMDSVGLDEPVIIPQSATLEDVIWEFTVAGIERRAYELKAETNWMELQTLWRCSGVLTLAGNVSQLTDRVFLFTFGYDNTCTSHCCGHC